FKPAQVQESLERLIYDPDKSVRRQAVESSAYCLGLSRTAELVRKGPEDIAVALVEYLPYRTVCSNTTELLEQFSGHRSEKVRAAVLDVAAGLLDEYDGKPSFKSRLEALASRNTLAANAPG